MRTQGIKAALLVLVVGVLVGGCAKDAEDQIAMLEQNNRDLAEAYNQMRADHETCLGREQQCADALAQLRGENDSLRTQLAAKPQVIEKPVEVPAGWTEVPGGAMIAIDDSVLFEPGKAVLREQAKRALDAVVSTVQSNYRDKDILVFGHTDDQPIRKSGWQDNWQLSSERALAVVRYLQGRSVDAGRLVACGCGEHRPRVPNSSSSNRASNRRVEIFALEPQGR
jgi:chemotaxis protein MotB